MIKGLSLKKGGILVFALSWLFVTGAPFYFMVLTGFKKQFELLSGGIWSLPESPTMANFIGVL